MRTQPPLRPELASVFLYVAPTRIGRVGRVVRPCPQAPGVLGALASGRGLQ